jgi:uncharacterized protein with GYD domain
MGDVEMAKFLWRVSYTTQGVQGVLKEGGSSRRQLVTNLVEAAGGKVEVFYYTFGEDDVIVIAELPDNATAAAVSLTVGASGAAEIRTTALLEPEEIDAATKISVAYRAPGT